MPPQRRLDLTPCSTAAVRRLESELGLSHVTAQVLVRRGLDGPQSARAWLAADERHPPSAFAGMDAAVALVRRHVAAGSPITIHGDYDVDGVCSTAILVRALRSLGAQPSWYLPSRSEDGYGLRAHTVARLAASGTKLLITADCAVTAVEEIAAARAAGMDVLVTDHHAPRADGALPDAPIVHPALCGYSCPDLCAAGVAHKLAEALGAATVAEDLDLVALATVADVVALRGENRRLVREGLQALRTTHKPGLRALMAVARCDAPRLDARAVAFRLAPRINAAGRLQRADAGLELVLTTDPDRAQAVAEELDRVNHERRQVEQRMLHEAEAQVREQAGAFAHVVAAEGWHPGVAGIVASRLVERHHRPAVVIAIDSEGGATGSARSIPAFDLLGGLEACAQHLGRHGGHRAAAGLEIDPTAIDAFRAALCAHAESVLTPDDLVAVQRVDAVAAGGDLGQALAEELERLEPFGQGNPSVTLLIPAAQLADARPMGEGGAHVRFTVHSGGVRARAVAFGCEGRLPVECDTPADIAVALELNHYNGSVEPRLRLRHAQRCAPAPIAVVGEPEDHLAAAFAALDAPLEPPEPVVVPLARTPLDPLAAAQPTASSPCAPHGGARGSAAAAAPYPGAPGSAAAPAPHPGAPGSAAAPAPHPGAPGSATAPPHPGGPGSAAAPAPHPGARGRATAPPHPGGPSGATSPSVTRPAVPVDRRGRGVAGTLAALVASGEPVLAVCADVPERLPALRERLGGFALASWAALRADPALGAPYAHVVAIDPPPWRGGLVHATVLAWGVPELHFARQIHEREHRLRDPLAALYRALRDAGGARGEQLASLLRGPGRPWSATLGGRLLRVLEELELVEVDRMARAVRVPVARRTELERSPAYRASQRRLEEGLAWLSVPAAGPAAQAA